MTLLQELESKYNQTIYLKKYFDNKYFIQTCNEAKIHQFRTVIHRLNLWKRMEDRLEVLQNKYQEPQKIKSFFGKSKFQNEEQVYDTLGEIFFSAYFVEKFGDKVELEKNTNGKKNCDIYVDLRGKQYKGYDLDEYYIEIRTVRDTKTDNSGNQILKGKTLDKLGEKNSDGSIKESQFIDDKKNILLLIDLHSKTSSHDSHAVVHGRSNCITRTEGKDKNGKFFATEPKPVYEDDGIIGDLFTRDKKLSLIGHLQASGKIYHFEDETFRLVSNPSATNSISEQEKQYLFNGTFAKEYQTGKLTMIPGEDIFSGKIFDDITEQIHTQVSKLINNSLSN